MPIKLQYTSSEILNKEFKIENLGYESIEVDKFLDSIIRDYLLVENNYLVEKNLLDKIKEENTQLKSKLKTLEIENASLRNKLKLYEENPNASKDNLDLIKRISTLEKYLYNHGVRPDTIK